MRAASWSPLTEWVYWSRVRMERRAKFRVRAAWREARDEGVVQRVEVGPATGLVLVGCAVQRNRAAAAVGVEPGLPP